MSTSQHRVVAIVLAFAICTSGCTKTRVAMVGRCEEPIGESNQRVEHGGVYTANWTASDKKHLHPIQGSARLAATGERLGFQRYGNGQIIGTHGNVRLALAGTPRHIKYIVWCNKKTVATQFGKEMLKVQDGARVAAQATLTAAAVVGVGFLIYEAAKNDPDFLSNLLSDEDSSQP